MNYKEEIEKIARDHVYKLDKGPFKDMVVPYVSEDQAVLNRILEFAGDRYPGLKDKVNVLVSDPTNDEHLEGYFDPEGVSIDLRNNNLTQEEYDNLKEALKDDVFGSRVDNGMLTVISPDDKYTLLHEIGHGVDHDKKGELSRNYGKYERYRDILMGVTPLASAVGGLIHPLAGLGVTAVGTVGATAMAHQYNKRLISGEFGANEFAREYLEHELGSAEDARSAYRESTLPSALNSYRRHNRSNLSRSALSTLALGLVGTAYGACSTIS